MVKATSELEAKNIRSLKEGSEVVVGCIILFVMTAAFCLLCLNNSISHIRESSWFVPLVLAIMGFCVIMGLIGKVLYCYASKKLDSTIGTFNDSYAEKSTLGIALNCNSASS